MNTVLKRYAVFDVNSTRGRCVVYAKNSLQAAEEARDVLRYLLGGNPKTVYVYSTYEDGSAKDFLTRFTY